MADEAKAEEAKAYAEIARVHKWQWITLCVLIVCVSSCVVTTSPNSPFSCEHQKEASNG